jgi:hypothetical protein
MDESRRRLALETFGDKLQTAQEMPAGADQIELYQAVGREIGADEPIRYLEFGVFDGTSMRKMTRVFTNPKCEFVGFDSFEGLPEDWHDLTRGQFDRGGELPFSGDERVRFVKGWFQNTVPAFMRGLQFTEKKTTLVHFDADLYSSTLFLLAAMWFDLPDYYFIFDEFFVDEVIALYDFTSAFPVEIDFFAKTVGPMHVAGRLSRSDFVPTR